jgi:hypothetical protein
MNTLSIGAGTLEPGVVAYDVGTQATIHTAGNTILHTIAQLDACADLSVPFVQSLYTIYSYNADEQQDTLNKFHMGTLK